MNDQSIVIVTRTWVLVRHRTNIIGEILQITNHELLVLINFFV